MDGVVFTGNQPSEEKRSFQLLGLVGEELRKTEVACVPGLQAVPLLEPVLADHMSRIQFGSGSCEAMCELPGKRQRTVGDGGVTSMAAALPPIGPISPYPSQFDGSLEIFETRIG